MILQEEARIKVAKALRECDPKSFVLPLNVAATLAKVGIATTLAGVGNTDQNIIDTLATMVDSTCKIVDVDEKGMQDKDLCTLSLSCGHSVTLYAEAKMPKYCPYCGRRVVLL